MKIFLFLTKRKIFIALAVVLIAFSVAVKTVCTNFAQISGATPKERLTYITSLGYNVEESSALGKQTVIPTVFSDVYKNYNKIQKSAGFDLTDYKGKSVTIYTYNILSSDKKLNLIVHKGTIIGGDVCDYALNGEMKPLKSIK